VIGVNALNSLHCFDTVGRVTEWYPGCKRHHSNYSRSFSGKRAI